MKRIIIILFVVVALSGCSLGNVNVANKTESSTESSLHASANDSNSLRISELENEIVQDKSVEYFKKIYGQESEVIYANYSENCNNYRISLNEYYNNKNIVDDSYVEFLVKLNDKYPELTDTQTDQFLSILDNRTDEIDWVIAYYLTLGRESEQLKVCSSFTAEVANELYGGEWYKVIDDNIIDVEIKSYGEMSISDIKKCMWDEKLEPLSLLSNTDIYTSYIETRFNILNADTITKRIMYYLFYGKYRLFENEDNMHVINSSIPE